MDYSSAMMKLHKIFKEKSWINKDKDEFAFNNFCLLFDNLSSEQRELILELTERYTWIAAMEYHDAILSIIQSIPNSVLEGVTEVHFFPIIKPGDEDKYKSGEHLIYHIKANRVSFLNFKGIKIRFLKRFDDFNKISFDPVTHRLFLVDDFIGSGDTLDQCLNEFKTRNTIDNPNINVTCISCQRETLDRFRTEGIQFFSQHVINKGISDYNDSPVLEEKRNMMKVIEKSIPGSKSFSLGWNESEATVTLMRTPDNTFPIFWKKYRKKTGEFIDAPFSREETND